MLLLLRGYCCMILVKRFNKGLFKSLFFLVVIGAFLVLLFFSVYTLVKDNIDIGKKNGKINLEVDYLNIGQGDGILIKSPYGQNILIDGGPDDSVLEELEEVLPWWDRKIDLMILSHPHSDHVTGLGYVLDSYKVEKVLYTGVSHTAPGYLEWLTRIRDKNIELLIIDKQQKIKLGNDCFLEILYPYDYLGEQDVENLNNTSIVLKLVYGNNEFLFAGDAEQEVENILVDNEVDLKADVFKVSHHGSSDSNSLNFLRAINPEFAIIQVGVDNNFGHPSGRVLDRLKKIGSKIYRNDIDGLVRVFSDGEKIRID